MLDFIYTFIEDLQERKQIIEDELNPIVDEEHIEAARKDSFSALTAVPVLSSK